VSRPAGWTAEAGSSSWRTWACAWGCSSRVSGATVVDTEAVEAVLAHLPPAAGALLAGQVTDEQGPFGVLDLDAVFALASTLPRARRAG